MTKSVSTFDANSCMKCGFCMSNCPVYAVDHIESHVARGRNILVKQVIDRKTNLSFMEEALTRYYIMTRFLSKALRGLNLI